MNADIAGAYRPRFCSPEAGELHADRPGPSERCAAGRVIPDPVTGLSRTEDYHAVRP